MGEYEKAVELLNKGFAERHYTFKNTGCIVISLEGNCVGYILPANKYVDVAEYNTHIGNGCIDLDKMMVVDASHRPDCDRHIEKYDSPIQNWD